MIDNNIIYAAVALVCSILLAFSLTPAVRVLAFKVGAIDVPRDNRRMHKKPILQSKAIITAPVVADPFPPWNLRFTG